MKKIKFLFVKMESKSVCFETVELHLSREISIDPSYIIKITRPALDEERVKSSVSAKRKESLEKSLFADHVREQMEADLKIQMEDEIKRIRKMPCPIIFIGAVFQMKYREGTIIKLTIPKNIAKYFLEYKQRLDSLFIEFEPIPNFIDTIKKTDDILDKFKNFEEENEDMYEDKTHRSPYETFNLIDKIDE